MTWPEFYKRRVNNPSSLGKFRGKYLEFFLTLAATKPETVAEFGCGIGSCTKILLGWNPKIKATLVDSSTQMLRMADLNLEPGHHVGFVRADIRESLSLTADVIFSHGVLEHFDPPEVRRIISLQKKKSGVMIHSVPSNKYKSRSFGDERLLSPDDWQKLAEPDLLVTHDDGHEIVMIWGNKPRHPPFGDDVA